MDKRAMTPRANRIRAGEGTDMVVDDQEQLRSGKYIMFASDADVCP